MQRLIVYFKDAELLAVRALTRPDIPRTIVARSIFPLPFAPIQPKRHKIYFTTRRPFLPSISSRDR